MSGGARVGALYLPDKFKLENREVGSIHSLQKSGNKQQTPCMKETGSGITNQEILNFLSMFSCRSI